MQKIIHDIKVHSDDSYLSVTKSRRQEAGHLCCGDGMPLPAEDDDQGSTCNECSVEKPIVASAS